MAERVCATTESRPVGQEPVMPEGLRTSRRPVLARRSPGVPAPTSSGSSVRRGCSWSAPSWELPTGRRDDV